MENKTVLIADDHQLILDGIINLLKKHHELTIIGTATNGHELVKKAIELTPDIIITDIEMPEQSGIEAIKVIKDKLPKTKIVVLSMHNDSVIESILVKLEVDGIIYKNANEEIIEKGILEVASGNKFKHSSEKRAAPILSEGVKLEEVDLTSREIQIIKMVAEGYTNKEIAVLINISPRTVDTHRSNLMKKLNLHSAVDITRFAFKNKLL